jgi:hypothetical protein
MTTWNANKTKLTIETGGKKEVFNLTTSDNGQIQLVVEKQD